MASIEKDFRVKNGIIVAENATIGGNLNVLGDLNVSGAQVLSGDITLGDASGDTVTINAGTTTLTQGTANGVLYLNGSKAITSGTALTFDGTNFGTSGSIGINGAAPQTPLDVISNASGYGITLRGRSGDNASSFRFTSNNYATQYASLDSGSAYLLFGISASEQMRLTSTGLGIGTSAPTSKLDVNGVIKAATIEATSLDSIKLPATTANIDIGTVWGTHLINFRAGGTPFFSISTTGGAVCNTGGFVSGLSAVSSFGSNNNYDVSFIRNNIELMRLTSTGLGIGTSTPSSLLELYSDNPRITLSDLGAQARITNLSGNLYYDTSSVNRDHIFQGAGTEAARITGDGLVGIGTSSPAAQLDVFNGSGGGPAARFWVNEQTIENLAGFQIYNNQSGGFVDTTLVYGNTVNSYLAFGQHNGSSYTERMRIDSAGSLLVGYTTSTESTVGSVQLQGPLLVGGALSTNQTNRGVFQYAGNETSIRSYGAFANDGFITFRSGGGGSDTERMRLTSAGNLGIGTTAPGVLSGGFDVSSYKVVQTNGVFGRAYNIQSAAGFCVDLKENTSGTTGRRVLQQTWNSDLYTWTVQSEVNGAPYSTPLVMTAAGNFGIGNTAPAAKLQVDQVGIQTTTTAITTTTETIVYSYPAATFRTAELMCQIVDSTNSQYHSAKFMIIHNSTDVWFNQTSVIHSHDELGTFTVNILSGNVRLLFTPTAATTKSVKVAATMLTS
jgi:hypothetical protein